MMELDCQKCDEGLVEFLYGELGRGESDAFEHHLRSCPKCAAMAEQLRQTRDLFANLEEAEPPPIAALDQVMAEAQTKAEQMATGAPLEPEPTPSLWEQLLDMVRGAALRPALGTAFTILLVAGIGLLIWSDRPQHSPGTTGQESLSPIPTSELSTRRSEEVPQRPPVEITPTPEPVMPDEASKTLAQRPPRPIKAPSPREKLLKRPPAKRSTANTRDEESRRAGSSVNESTADRITQAAPSSPIVVEAEEVSAENRQRPSQEPPRTSTVTPPGVPVIQTPPLPQAVSEAGRQQVAPQEQQPTPTAAAGPTPQQPVRVSTPGQSQYDRGMQAYRTGRYNDAADELDAFVRSPSAPNHLVPAGMHHLAMSQRQTGNLSAAARSYEQLLQRFPSYNRRPQAMLEAARVYARLGSFDRAERLLNQLASIPGWSSRAQTELTRIQHLRAGQSGQMGPAFADEAAEEVGE